MYGIRPDCLNAFVSYAAVVICRSIRRERRRLIVVSDLFLDAENNELYVTPAWSPSRARARSLTFRPAITRNKSASVFGSPLIVAIYRRNI